MPKNSTMRKARRQDKYNGKEGKADCEEREAREGHAFERGALQLQHICCISDVGNGRTVSFI